MQLGTFVDAAEALAESSFETMSPFAEAQQLADHPGAPLGFAPWAEALSPFAGSEALGEDTEDTEVEETLNELYDEGFHEAVALLAEETEQAVSDRFVDERSMYAGERERFGRSYLSGVQFEAEQYLTTLESGLANADVASFSSEQLDEMLDRFDPASGELTPAGEEFVGKLVKKAKRAVKVVANVAKAAGKLAAPFLAPMLKRLRVMVKPLLDRVLSLAIGRLPEPLQPAARSLANKILAKAAPSFEGEDEGMAPAVNIDAEGLADSFDLRLAEAILRPDGVETEDEALLADHDSTFAEGNELQSLAEARGALIDSLSDSNGRQDIAPAIEQFAPAVLMALRTGVRLIGRPRIVSFLSGYLAKMIRRWVEPSQAPKLANAIVDAGMRMISLEAETGETGAEVAQTALASVIEDTIRRFADNEEYMFEDEDLAQVAAADAFGEAVAAYFPQEQVRQELQLAPSLGGAFVTRRARSLRSYAKYNRTPEIEISARAADAIPSFGDTSLGANMRAEGARFPMRARLHIYQTKPGTTVASMLKHDRKGGQSATRAHPLTPTAAGTLLREPGLGTRVPRRFMRNHRRVAAGQRIFVIEPLSSSLAMQGNPAPGRVWIAVNAAKARITAGFYLSEEEAQRIAEAIRKGQGHGDLLRRMLTGFQEGGRNAREAEDGDGAKHEDGESFEDFAARAGGSLPHGFKALLRRRIAEWALPAVSAWLRQNTEPFLRAASDPRPGVTIRVRMAGVAGLTRRGGGATLKIFASALKSKPAISILVRPGRGR